MYEILKKLLSGEEMESHTDDKGSTPAATACLLQPKMQQQPRATFKRRASLSNDKSLCPPLCSQKVDDTNCSSAVDCQTTSNSAHPAPAVLSLARVCGPSRSRCGYCGGKRMHVLGLDDGHNKVLSIGKDKLKNIDKIDATKTSKSYGLLFDRIPYDTYEDLINHGWRRSGKHIYRPHNFESCCPALSIRLECCKFQERSTCQKSKSSISKSDGSDAIADTVLVGGSKSQRRVGQRLLRALDVYNSKCCLQSEDDSVNASNLANIQLDNNRDGLNATKPIRKKSRRFSPIRQNYKSSPVAVETAEFDRESLHAIETREQHFLHSMAKLVYQEVTKIAIERSDNPQWAWWNNNETDDVIPKWCTFKLVSQGASIKASTAACAAASGRSRGSLNKVELASTLVVRLNDCTNDYLQNNKSCGVRVKEVLVHEKSGQVHMLLDVSTNIQTAAAKDAAKEIPTQKSLKPDAIQEMISRYTRADQQFSPTASMSHNNKCTQRFLTVRSIPVYESSLQPEVHRLFCLYQSTTHGDFNPFDDFDNTNNFRDESHEYNYYKQKNLPGFLDVDTAYSHLDEIRRSKIKTSYLTFFRFLCETPVPTASEQNTSCPSNEDGYDIGIPFGTYHQQYRLSTSKDAFDGPLVAVGVVDVLPHCMSSVYAFYDPIFSARLELGKYTALREIEWVRRASKYRKELKYYYLGELELVSLLHI